MRNMHYTRVQPANEQYKRTSLTDYYTLIH